MMSELLEIKNQFEELQKRYQDHLPKVDQMIVGGGFSGVETVGELNDFVRESIKHYYHNLEDKDAKIILVNSGRRILPEVTEDLAVFNYSDLGPNAYAEVIAEEPNSGRISRGFLAGLGCDLSDAGVRAKRYSLFDVK